MKVSDLFKAVQLVHGKACVSTVEAYFYDLVLFLIIKVRFRFNPLVNLQNILSVLFSNKIVKLWLLLALKTNIQERLKDQNCTSE